MSEKLPTKVVTKRDNGKLRIQTFNREPSKTQQQFRDMVNVNNIMKKYHATREITHLNNRQGKYADITNAQEYFEATKTITEANQAFEQLPSHVRKRFGNDPSALLEFIHNPDNYDEGVKLGIFDPKIPNPNPPQNNNPLPGQNNDDLNDDKPPVPSSKKK